MKEYNIKLIFLILLQSALMLSTAGLWGVVETSEARYAEISREMLRSGDWINPTLLNIHHYHKPPLTYWITTVGLKLFGVNSFAVRFFLVIAYAIQVMLVHSISKTLFSRPRLAWYASVIYSTLPIVLVSVRGLTTDAYVATFVLLGLFGWIRFLKKQNLPYLWIAVASLASAFLAKGPVVLVVPIFASLSLINIFTPPRGYTLQYIIAGLLFLLLSLSWFAFLITQNKEFLDYFVLKHLIDRISNAQVFGRDEPWYYYLVFIPPLAIPWIFVFIRGLFKLKNREGESGQLGFRILMGWFVVPMIFFSFASSKLILYVIPLFSGFSIVTAYYYDNDDKPLWKWPALVSVLIVYLALFALPIFYEPLHLPWWVITFPIIAILLTVYFLINEENVKILGTRLAVLFTATLLGFSAFAMNQNGILFNTTEPLAEFIQKEHLADRPVFVFNELLPSLAFELDKEVISIYNGTPALRRETQFEYDLGWKQYLLDLNNVDDIQRLKEVVIRQKIVLITDETLPHAISNMMKGVWRQARFDDWIIYYN